MNTSLALMRTPHGPGEAVSHIWHRLADYIGDGLGLHYPAHRLVDLARAFAPAVRALGFEDPVACIDWLLAQPPSREHHQLLARHLAIGETYFFRDPQQLQAVQDHVLAPLVAARRGTTRHLRLWSAACGSGEEAYTLSMLLRSLLSVHEIRKWQVDIVGTDLRGDALVQAAAGLYGPWSFRSMPQALRQQHFRPVGDGRLEIQEEIRLSVRFAPVNLVQSLAAWSGTDMDLILCRNVLMYFDVERARRVVAGLRACLRDDGWLVVGAAELPAVPWEGFEPVRLPGAVLLRKISVDVGVTAPPQVPGPKTARSGRAVEPPVAFDATTVRELADQGRTHEALVLCERWLRDAVPDAQAHYLHAMILQERGVPIPRIREALQRALQCDAGFVLAHFTLGHLARREACDAQAGQHFAAVQRLLRHCTPGQPIPGGEGLTAAALAESVAALALQDLAR